MFVVVGCGAAVEGRGGHSCGDWHGRDAGRKWKSTSHGWHLGCAGCVSAVGGGHLG